MAVALSVRTVAYPTAMALLDISRTTLDRLCDREVFTVVRPRGKGRGLPVFLWADEVDVYASTRDELAVRALRVKMRRVKRQRTPSK